MAILIASSRIQYPDFASPEGGVQALLDKAKNSMSAFLNAADSRVFNNSFVEDGTQNVSGSSFIDSKFSDLVRPNRRTVKSQSPQATVLIKKRMFSSLRSNYDIRFLDADERIFIRAIKNLFRRKAEEISFYENLIVLDKVVEDPEFLTLDNFLDIAVGAFFSALDLGFATAETAQQALGTFFSGNDPGVFFRLKRLQDRAKQNKFTTWIVDPDEPDFSGTGPGVGVLELTWMTSINTTTSLDTGRGSASVTIEDPYRLTRITESDIDFALKQAINEDSGPVGFFDVTGEQQLNQAQSLDQELNSMRRDRQVSEINFEYDPNGDGEPFGSIIETQQNFNAFTVSQISDDQALTAPEVTRALNILDLLRSYKTIQDRSVSFAQISNQNSKSIRDKLRAEFVGHHIIQQMDSIHIFVNSFTRDETPVYANRADFVSSVTAPLLQAASSLEEQAGKLGDDALEIERQVLAPEMDLSEYKAIRNPLEWRGSGPQIFSGLVTEITSDYRADNGKFTLSVSAADNIEYLRLSRINVSPGLSQPQGVLNDPLTPYDISTDPISGLVIDKHLSQTNLQRLPFLRFADGALLGQKVKQESRLYQNSAAVAEVLAYQHVPGLVYKWKQGILTATQNVNLTRPLSRSKSVLNDVREDFGLTLTNTPFDNLDAADILSILITGQPYNYNNFVQSALDAGNFSVDNDTNNRTYFNYLFDFLERLNPVNGNFVPAKPTSLDPDVVNSAFQQQKQATANNTKLSELQRQLAQLKDGRDKVAQSTESSIVEKRNEVDALINDISSQIAQLNSASALGSLGLGADALFQSFGNSVHVHFTADDQQALKKKLKYIVRKKPEEVRYNQDKNYFVVSEQYDSDFNIQAFVLELKGTNGLKIFESDWQMPYEICRKVADTIDFELFADSQGNIVFRPPQYNRTPLSLLLQMIQLANSDGISLGPPFLTQMMSNRVDLVSNQILEIELQILENAYILGFTSNADIAIKFGINIAAAPIMSPQGGLSYILNQDILFASLISDAVFTGAEQTQVVFGTQGNTVLQRQLSDPTNSSTIDLVISIRNQLAIIQGATQSPLDPSNQDDRNSIDKELERFFPPDPSAFTNRLTLSNQIAQFVTKRQSLARMLQSLSKDNTALQASNGLGTNFNVFNLLGQAVGSELSGGPVDTPSFPKFMENFIENDMSNLTGFNSSKRYIIEDDVIISMRFSIQTPQFNRIDVQGSTNLVGNAIKNGANPLYFWAGATDFDSWRQFGYRGEQTFDRPFLQNPETQCAPYAVSKLTQQRKKIHSGTITIVGNEFYEAGDVVYVNNRQMLYYVNSVHHSVNVGTGAFQTTLDLSYGHAIGDYIPTFFDSIGKTLLANTQKHLGNLKALRAVVPSATVVHLETLAFPITSESQSVATELLLRPDAFNFDLSERTNNLSEQFKKVNYGKVQNALKKASLRLNSNSQDQATIEVRGYYLAGTETIARAQTYITFAAELLTQGLLPTQNIAVDSGLNIVANGSPLSNALQAATGIVVAVPPIDLQEELTPQQANLRRIPSEQAWAIGADVNFGPASGLPVNAIDLFLVIQKSQTGIQLNNVNNVPFGHSVDPGTIQSSLADAPLPTSATSAFSDFGIGSA